MGYWQRRQHLKLLHHNTMCYVCLFFFSKIFSLFGPRAERNFTINTQETQERHFFPLIQKDRWQVTGSNDAGGNVSGKSPKQITRCVSGHNSHMTLVYKNHINALEVSLT